MSRIRRKRVEDRAFDKELEVLDASFEVMKPFFVGVEKDFLRGLNEIPPPMKALKFHKKLMKSHEMLLAGFEEKGVLNATMEWVENSELRAAMDRMNSLLEEYHLDFEKLLDEIE